MKRVGSHPKGPALRQTQRLMASVIMNPLSDAQKTKRSIASGVTTASIAQKIIKPNTRLSSLERLELYNRQYWFRLIDSLYEDYPGVCAILGDVVFHKVIDAYLRKHPSRSYTLRNLGDRMPKFLASCGFIPKIRRHAAIQVAQFEWAQVLAFDSVSLPPLVPSALNSAQPNKIFLKLQPYVQLLTLDFPVDEFILSLRKERKENSEAGAQELAEREILAPAKLPKLQKTFLVIHRYDNALYYKRLEAGGYLLLQQCSRGKSLAAACLKVAKLLQRSGMSVEEANQKIQGWFTTWSSLGWFAAAAKNSKSVGRKIKRRK